MAFKIYCVTCILNGKKYYGQTSKTLEKRWQGHLRAVRRDNQGYHLHRAIRKYGEQNFKMELLEEVATKQAANEREMHYIDRDNTLEEGYNMTKGGEGSFGRKVSEEEKAKKLATYKKTMINGFSEEHRRKLSEARKKHSGPNKGKKFSEEHLENLRKSQLGNTNAQGLRSEETRMKIIKGIAAKGKTWEQRYGIEVARSMREKRARNKITQKMGKEV